MHLIRTGTSTRTRRPLAATATGIAALAVAGSVLLSGCAPGGQGGPGSAETWVSFGPFEKPARYADDAALPGPVEIRTPSGDALRLDAAELLGSGRPLADRDNYEVTSEEYSFTLDGDEPVIVGIVQTTHTMHYRGYTEDEHVTFVLGISADGEPRELSRTRIFRGAEHTATLSGRSDLGVVAVLLDGELNTNVEQDSRVIGVDAVRGTEVWAKEHGYPGYGEGEATFYAADSPEACATEVQRYAVASGIAESTERYANTDVANGGTCRTAAGDPAS